ncbi:MAG: DNA polymerase I [Candidatus Lumbricidophila eiseniae]|uniref:DNA polymerase I n=1 Tax=Candidatus Lumbricidiphila eiseniae TaxID=1969409 RepID=A0A2A6FQ64_9MICO|nr:MAG: DNA polymerase I [Candidatus Lumbricidophila eiseniae]
MSDAQKPTLLVVDGHSLAFRAFYALPVANFTTRDGQHTNAIHGFLSMLLLLLQNEKPTHVAVAFDLSRASFRTIEYPEYKGTRSETPEPFKGQVPLLQEALQAMGITILVKENFEADDILATLAHRAETEGFRVLLVSGDRDSIQLVTDNVTLLYPNTQGVSQLKRYDPAAVTERYGVRPEQYPDIAALVGESSDNLIGIDKVGEKTAVKWLEKYGDLAGILAHAEEITGVVGQNLRDQKENAIRNRRLNELVRDVPLEVTLDELAACPINLAAVTPVFERLEFKTLLDRLRKLAVAKVSAGGATALDGSGLRTTAVHGAPVDGDPGVEGGAPLAPPAPTPRVVVGAALADWFARVTAATPSGLGLELEVLDGQVIGAGVASGDETVQFSWSAGNSDLLAFERWLSSDAPKIMTDAKPQLKALRRSGLACEGLVLDVQLAAGMLNPQQPSASLGELVWHYLGEHMPQPDPAQLVPEDDSDVGAAGHAWYCVRLAPVVLSALPEASRRLLTEVEIPLVAVLAEMELRGVAVDRSQLTVLSAELAERIASLAASAYAEIGREVNLASPKQLQEVLFGQLGMPKTRATKTGHTTDASALVDLQASHPHPFLGYLLEHRDATKLRQIVETLDRAIGTDGRVHTTYGQLGAATGRMSSNDPNLQNIPIRTEEGRRIRAAFCNGEGYSELLTADYSQIEMRIMAHLSDDAGLIEAFQSGEDLHRFVGARVFGVDPADVTHLMRTKVKAMSYGLAYGLSAFGLSKQLRIDQSEAKLLMAEYFQRFGAVRDYLRGVVEQARTVGYTETIFGRRRPFPDLQSPNRVHRENAERAALNSPIQGTAADIVKIAMVGIEADATVQGLRSRMLMQVHDELVFELAAGEEDAFTAIVSDRMSHAAVLSVPLDVQLGRGSNWDIAAH